MGDNTNAAYVRARLKRDAADTEHPEKQDLAARLLPRVQSGEITPRGNLK